LTSAEEYDPAAGTWTPTGSMASAREDHTAPLLKDDRVLIVSATSAGLYHPKSANFTDAGTLAADWSGHAETLLPNGNVLVTGSSSATAEMWSAARGILDAGWNNDGGPIERHGNLAVWPDGSGHRRELLGDD